MANAAPARASAIRFTRTDACGVPVAEATANSRVTTAAFVNVNLASDLFTSNDIRVVGASGAVCVDDKGVSSLLGYDVSITLCNFNTAILEMTLGAAILDDGGGNDIGGVITADGTFNANTVMVEWFPTNASSDACAGGGNPYLHYLLPRVNRWTLSGNVDFGDAATTLTLQGYAQPTTAFAASRAADPWQAADLLAINANGLLAWTERADVPVTVAQGYDA